MVDDGCSDGCKELGPPSLGADAAHGSCSESKETRPWCSRCDRATKVCICAALPPGSPFKVATEIVVLVHPKEIKRKCGTLPLLKACITDLRIIKGESFPEPNEDPALHDELTRDGGVCVLVCPGDNAMSPEELQASVRTSERQPARLVVILIDGTWAQAKGMVRKSKWLQTIPRVVIQASEHSGYVFRQQPQDGCLSTLEAAAELLEALEGEYGTVVKTGLKALFAAMVQEQVKFIPAGEAVDKNAPGGREAFRQAVLDTTSSSVEDRSTLPPVCICSWGDWVDPGVRRQMHIERILYGMTTPEADSMCRELTAGRKKGSRLFITKLDKVSEDAIRDEAITIDVSN
eukprot:TRINITY_DN15471_c0_g1_i1.p1 TRINITY_DN15471_c0_g1~~TRINITY_DN15471_c0_g1_i1.p1  ORF type:complete len:365 (+),score=55.24 TRINITY_DN15471_c0_g1_i1:56-1096(+)